MFFRFISFYLLMLISLSCSKSTKEENTAPPVVKTLTIKSVDASFLPIIRLSGVVTKNRNGQQEDILATLKNETVNTIRIRLWKDPANVHSGFNEVKTLAQEIKSMGMKVWICVHYSDTWADPGAQSKPAVWNGISFLRLKDSVYAYTQKIVTEIKPDYIQIGNEINAGLLWPDGSIANLSQMTDLLKQGIKAVRDLSPQTKIMLHHAGHENAANFYANLNSLDYDMIALSYYPIWHGKDLNQLQTSINNLGTQFNKEIIIAETAYPFTLGWNDYTNNILGLNSQILTEFPATEQGQKDYLLRIKKMVLDAPRGTGLCYWGGEFIAFDGPVSTNGSPWENQALWDFSNNALPAISIFKD